MRHRYSILVGALALAMLAAGSALHAPRRYRASAVVLPEGNDASLSSMALAASQFGVRLPATGGAWTPAVYYTMLRHRAFYAELAADSLSVPEEGGRRRALVDLFEVDGDRADVRIAKMQRELTLLVGARELKEAGGIEVSVETPWPSVSLALGSAVVARLEHAALEARQSRATAERHFIEQRVDEARTRLREAEARLRRFEESNRVIITPTLQLERGRLQRDVSMQQQLHTTLLQSQEDLRLRESRDTPTLTVLAPPRLPVLPESRRVVLKTIVGFMGGALLTLLLLVAREWTRQMRRRALSEGGDLLEAVVRPRHRTA